MTGPFVLPASSVPALPSIAVAGTDERFPVRRILCVGRNYADHAREMGSDPDREPPFFFAKPGDAAVPASGVVPYPTMTAQLEYEVELVVAIGVGGASIAPEAALAHVWGYAVGVDLTRRDRQQEAKDTRRPWEVAKGFDASAPVTPLVSATPQSGAGGAGGGAPGAPVDGVADAAAALGAARAGSGGGAAGAGAIPAAGAGAIPAAGALVPHAGRIWLAVNGETKQQGDLADQIWPVADVIAAASRAWTLAPGDLIMTGTPSGVGPIVPGDVVTGGIEGVGDFSFTVGAAPGV